MELHKKNLEHILITGGAGFIGSYLTNFFLDKNFRVTVLDNISRGNIRRLKKQNNLKIIKGDIRNPKIVDKACKKVNSVIHLAAINGTENFYTKPELVLEVAISGTMNIINSCIKHKITKLYLASSSEVYQNPETIPTNEKVRLIVPDPHNPRYSYGGGKIISELLCLNYGKKYFKKAVIFRPHNVFGPDMGWEHVIPQLVLKIKNRKRNTITLQGSGKESRAFIEINDFCEAFFKVYNKGKHLEIYNIGNDNEIKINDLLKKIIKILNLKINIKKIALKQGSPLRRCPEITKIKKIGYKPNYDIDKSLIETVNWYTNNNKKS